MMLVMAKCLVLRCEEIPGCEVIEYTALSPLFDEIPEGSIPPLYYAMLETVTEECDGVERVFTLFKEFVKIFVQTAGKTEHLLSKIQLIKEGNTAILPSGEIVPRGMEGSMDYDSPARRAADAYSLSELRSPFIGKTLQDEEYGYGIIVGHEHGMVSVKFDQHGCRVLTIPETALVPNGNNMTKLGTQSEVVSDELVSQLEKTVKYYERLHRDARDALDIAGRMSLEMKERLIEARKELERVKSSNVQCVSPDSEL